MRVNLILIAFIAFLGLTACNSQNSKVTAQNNKAEKIEETDSNKDKTPILVELFTSEG
jgi:large-conductance mechanosensitive channel